MKPLLTVSQLSRDFVKPLDMVAKLLNRLGQDYREEVVHAVDDVSFDVFKGEIVGVVGESGCGKSTLGRMIAGILSPTKGHVSFDASQAENPSIPEALRTQMIFQDPFSSLNPRKRVIDIITEAPIHHKLITNAEKRDFAAGMLQRVGLDPDVMERYPHQFSGGQRQRVGIARALAVSPEFLVCAQTEKETARAHQESQQLLAKCNYFVHSRSIFTEGALLSAGSGLRQRSCLLSDPVPSRFLQFRGSEAH